ncbi:MAG TPA: lysophospholipid acyltransferase family protein [Acidobacteriota bacterium]|nr:lysophospholipid acyltransferase family protein [Acidobacteriota bacterium]HNR39055.1 lysophospholipid acyltransferase family protein [Acidobacteriota bacterium]HNU01435.1 lysophospholipid acyltransferase family protein [Acidobacteriota bacterium]HPB27825.1 lysophospholipid acyltransferase family protein [Acidobacteriota bacterium]HQP73547.1 lysophospholipid acyltransferase family protein [Acidobacteriota bacterium]
MASKRSDALLYGFGRGIMTLLYVLPLGAAIGFTRWVAGLYFRLDRRHQRIADVNLSIAFPDMTPARRQQVARDSYRNLGEMLALIAHFPRLRDRKRLSKLVRYDFTDEYVKFKAENRPVLILTAHLGCWELLSFAHGVFHRPIHYLYRPLDNPRIDNALLRYRGLSGNQAISKRDASRKVLRALASGADVGILADQNVQEREGVFVDFFGKKACMTSGLALLALRSGAAVIPSFLVPDPERRTRYLIHALPSIPVRNTGNTEADVLENTSRYARCIEEAIRQWPDRWLWGHRRWKTRPVDDLADPYAGI